jgi:riboflavin synthase
MFTGIIEHFGTVESLKLREDGGRVTIHAPTLASKLGVSKSISVNGCCLTMISVENDRFSADLSGETIHKTSFGADTGGLREGVRVNLEQPLTTGEEFGGHFVLGHVDGIGHVTSLRSEGDNWWYAVRVPIDFARYIVEKGSITIDGVSLTVAKWFNFASARVQVFTVETAIIPYTYEHTNIRDRKPGDAVNLEGDILGKYVERYLEARSSKQMTNISIAELTEQGF